MHSLKGKDRGYNNPYENYRPFRFDKGIEIITEIVSLIAKHMLIKSEEK